MIAKEAGAEIEIDEHDGFVDVLATAEGLMEITKEAIDGQGSAL